MYSSELEFEDTVVWFWVVNQFMYTYQNTLRIMLYILIFKTDADITSIHEIMFMAPNNQIKNTDKMFED